MIKYPSNIPFDKQFHNLLVPIELSLNRPQFWRKNYQKKTQRTKTYNKPLSESERDLFNKLNVTGFSDQSTGYFSPQPSDSLQIQQVCGKYFIWPNFAPQHTFPLTWPDVSYYWKVQDRVLNKSLNINRMQRRFLKNPKCFCGTRQSCMYSVCFR